MAVVVLLLCGVGSAWASPPSASGSGYSRLQHTAAFQDSRRTTTSSCSPTLSSWIQLDCWNVADTGNCHNNKLLASQIIKHERKNLKKRFILYIIQKIWIIVLAGCSFVFAAGEGWSIGFRGQYQERLAGTAGSYCLLTSLLFTQQHEETEVSGVHLDWQSGRQWHLAKLSKSCPWKPRPAGART